MPVSERTKRIVWVRDGGSCSICKERLLTTSVPGLGTHLLGEVAHIVAEQPGGPRGASPLTADERNDEANLLLLCLNHHTIIDDDPSGYPVDHLHSLKAEHLAWVATRFQVEHPWRTRLHNFYYINVPRLNLLAASSGSSLNLSNYGEIIALHELGWELNGLMLLGFEGLLTRVELKSVDVADAVRQGASARGLLIAFDQDFRTKNIYMPDTPAGYRSAVKGDPKKDPQIYATVGDTRVVLTIDPRWVTTATAFVLFRPPGGKGKFAGLGIVNSMSTETKHMSISPLVIGLPSNPFLEAFYGGT